MTNQDQHKALVARLPDWTQIVRGSLVRYRLTCGGKKCRCRKGFKHGPYWYLSVNLDGRTKMRKLSDRQVPHVRQAVKNYQRWWKTCLRIFEINAQIMLSKGGF